MKRLLLILLISVLLCGCGPQPETPATTETMPLPLTEESITQIPFESRFNRETTISLSDQGIDVSGPNNLSVYTSGDIVYYEDRDTYDSGNPYGEGEAQDRHSPEEAAAHTVVNITAPGRYRVSGKLSAGQIRVDLGDEAYKEESARVELILEDADITCTVAPAIVFLNVYECDGKWSTDTASPNVDTANAGANLILEGENLVSGSYVARIYKDKVGEKKLWKQDGAIYSYMSMNVYGPGKLTLNAENEGLDSELHLTLNGGEIVIRSGNDGINTNEDGVSVTTINGGKLHITAGLGAEGDGIDSNGYLVINGGNVFSAAHPASDAGLDSDLGSFIHGGTVIALGAAMDWAESDSGQVTMNLQFETNQTGAITVTREDGTAIFAYDPAADTILGDNARRYGGAILSCGNFRQGETYRLYVDDTAMAYTGTDVMMGPGGFGGGPGQMPPEGMPQGQQPPDMPEDWTMPEGDRQPGFDWGAPPDMPEGQTPPDMPQGEPPRDGFGTPGKGSGSGTGQASTDFYMQDMVNFFSGIRQAD